MSNRIDLKKALVAFRQAHGEAAFAALLQTLGVATWTEIKRADFAASIVACRAGPAKASFLKRLFDWRG